MAGAVALCGQVNVWVIVSPPESACQLFGGY